MNTWDHYGKHDPYFGVLSADEYRVAKLDERARHRFFEAGERQVDEFLQLASETVGPVTRGRALDYGCGVGRLTRALAARFESVVAIDISQGMLEEARRNLAHRANVLFEDAGSSPTDPVPVDFVISKIVFQHIPPEQGLRILASVLGRLSVNGTGVIDFPVKYSGGPVRRIARRARHLWPFGEPMIPMHVYGLSDVEAVIRSAGLSRVHVKRQAVPRFEKAIIAFGR